MLRLLLIRHAESELHLYARHLVNSRSSHVTITEFGKVQSENLGRNLLRRKLPFLPNPDNVLFYSSTAVRCLETCSKALIAHTPSLADSIRFNYPPFSFSPKALELLREDYRKQKEFHPEEQKQWLKDLFNKEELVQKTDGLPKESSKIQVNVIDAFKEIDMGSWKGQERRGVYTPEVLKAIAQDPWNFKPEAAESLKEIAERAMNFIEKDIISKWCERQKQRDARVVQEEKQKQAFEREEIKNQSDALTACVFTHGILIKCILRQILNSDPNLTWRVAIDTASVTELHYNHSGWSVAKLNETAPLPYE